MQGATTVPHLVPFVDFGHRGSYTPEGAALYFLPETFSPLWFLSVDVPGVKFSTLIVTSSKSDRMTESVRKSKV